MISELPDDGLIVHCKGQCGAFVVIPLGSIARVLRKYEGKIKSFCDDYACEKCGKAIKEAFTKARVSYSEVSSRRP